MTTTEPAPPLLVQMLADDIRAAASREMLSPAALAEALVRRGWRPAADPDELQAEVERLRANVRSTELLADGLKKQGDAARAEVERLRERETMPCGSCHPCTEWANQTWINAGEQLPTFIRWQDTRVERDAAVREAASLRAGVEALADQYESRVFAIVGTTPRRVAGTLRALLAAPSPEPEHRPRAEELEPGRGTAPFCEADGQSWPCDHEQDLSREEPS